MGRRKFLAAIPKAGTGKNNRKRAQVAKHRRRAENRDEKKLPNSEEASPPALAAAAAATTTTTTTPAASYQRPSQAASCPVMAEKAPPTSNKIITPHPLSYNKSIINFETIPSEPVNTADAFKYNSNGQERSDAAKRKAKSRASKLIVDAIQNCADNPNDRAAALAAALSHPDIQGITKSIGITDPETSEMYRHAFNQLKRILERAMETASTRGRCCDDIRSFVESVFVALAASPEDKKRKNSTLINALGVPKTTGYRLFETAENKRRRLTQKLAKVSWSNVEQRQGYAKVSPEIRVKLLEWLLGHPNVVESPIAGETIWVRNLETGEREQVAKLLLQITIRELHNDMLLSPEKGGFKEAKDEVGNVLISDTALRALLPEQVRRMTPRHKQMCGCEVCIQMGYHQESMNQYRHNRLRTLKEAAAASTSQEVKQAIEAEILRK
jgi:hypothetical protein